MAVHAESRHTTKLECSHNTGRELLLIGLVVALGVLVALAIVIPAVVSS